MQLRKRVKKGAAILLTAAFLFPSASRADEIVAYSVKYWGADEEDRKYDFGVIAKASVFLDGDGVNSPSPDAKHLFKAMLRIAQASSAPAYLFNIKEFEAVILLPINRVQMNGSLPEFRNLTEFAVRQCSEADASDSCAVRHLQLSKSWEAVGDLEAAATALRSFVETNFIQGGAGVDRALQELNRLEAEHATGARKQEGLAARMELERYAEREVISALSSGNGALARIAIGRIPLPATNSAVLQQQLMRAYVDGDQPALDALLTSDTRATSACDVHRYIFNHPTITDLPPKGLPKCERDLDAQQMELGFFWILAAQWQPRIQSRLRAVSEGNARFAMQVAKLLGISDGSTASPVTYQSSNDEDAPVLRQGVAVGLTRPSGDISQQQANALFRILQHTNLGITGKSIALAAAEREARQVDPDLGSIVREFQGYHGQAAVAERAKSEAPIPAGKIGNPLSDIKRVEQLRSEILTRFPDYFSIATPIPVGFSDTQKLLRPDEVLIYASPSSVGTVVFAITSNAVKWSIGKLPAAEVQRVIQRLRWDLGDERGIPAQVGQRWGRKAGGDDRNGKSGDSPTSVPATLDARGLERTGTGRSYARHLAHDLYREIFDDIGPLLRDKRHMFVVASGDLATIPFGVLVASPPSGSDEDPAELRATDWMADRIAISSLPSIQMLEILRRRNKRTRKIEGETIFAGFGDPKLSGIESQRGASVTKGPALAASRSATGSSSISSVKELPELPGTRIELNAMREALGAAPDSVRLSGNATERAFRASLGNPTYLLSLATHGVVPFEIDGLSEAALILTPGDTTDPQDDGILRSSELAALRIDADWVFLSACNTGSTDFRGQASGTFSGLPEAFLYAGSQNLLVSHWPVLDEVAPVLTVRTVELARSGNSTRAGSLQSAIREVRNRKDHPGWAHPAAWGPFQLVGDGAVIR